MSEVIKVENLFKTFFVRKTFSGGFGAVKGLFSSKKSEFSSLQEISFSIRKGEKVAFIGPNGAGKSTAIKMLTGILYPTSGLIKVLGMTPWKQRHLLGHKIGTVFGQRTQLWPQLAPSNTFLVLSKIYGLDKVVYKKRLEELVSLFEIDSFFHKPVRQLSLGERMRCEVIASLLHNPQIFFLDEPTIGLDINSKIKIRSFLNKISKEYGTTLFLTSHDTADIEQVCKRVIVLDKGKIVLDSSLDELKRTFSKKKILSLTTEVEKVVVNFFGIKVLKNGNYRFICEVNLEKAQIDRVIHEVLKQTNLKDVTIENPSMEEIIHNLYKTIAL